MVKEDLSPLEVFILTIIGEARNQPIQGQVAVAWDIRNRLTTGKTYKDVCFAYKQFSCWNADDVNYPYLIDLGARMINGQMLDDIYLKQCQWVAIGVDNGSIVNNIKNTIHYLTNDMFNNKRPLWAKNAKDIIVIGDQTFFNV